MIPTMAVETNYKWLFQWDYILYGKSSPFMAEQFRLVKYYDLPRIINAEITG
jgi:hypothetical protein